MRVLCQRCAGVEIMCAALPRGIGNCGGVDCARGADKNMPQRTRIVSTAYSLFLLGSIRAKHVRYKNETFARRCRCAARAARSRNYVRSSGARGLRLTRCAGWGVAPFPLRGKRLCAQGCAKLACERIERAAELAVYLFVGQRMVGGAQHDRIRHALFIRRDLLAGIHVKQRDVFK